jgi:ABC-type transport system substrate-binding protein
MKKSMTYMLMAMIVLSSTALSVNLASAADVAIPFTVITGDTPSKLDPADAYDSVSIDAIAQVFEGLYKYNLSLGAGMASIPCIAKEMGTWSTDKLDLTIEIRDDVVFHDGTPLNATDIKWNFDRLFAFVADEANTPAVLYINDEGEPIVNETIIVDEYTIKFHLNKPWAVWEKLLAFSGSFILKPNDIFVDEFILPRDIEYAIGTGPFMITDLIPDEKTTFKRYEAYRDGPANIEEMVYLVIADGDTASLAMLNHEAHYGGVSADYLEEAEADPAITIKRLKTSTVFYMQMNVNNVPYAARRAMSFAFNYSYYVEVTLANQSYQLHTPVPEGMSYHNADIEGLPYYNVAMAKEILLDSTDPVVVAALAAAGIDEDSTAEEWSTVGASEDPIFEFNFTRYSSSGLDKFVAVLIDNMADIGIKINNYVVGDWGTWTEWVTVPANKAGMELSFGGWGPDYNDPINMMEPIYKTNASYNDCEVANSTLDTMMSSYYSLTGAAQEQMAWDIQEMIAVDICPTFYLYQRGGTLMYNNEFVSNVDDNLNIFGNWYFYNFVYTVEKPGIPGYSFAPMIISFAVVAGFLILKKRK